MMFDDFYMFVSNSPECFLVAKKASKPFKTLQIYTGMYREALLFLDGVARIRLSLRSWIWASDSRVIPWLYQLLSLLQKCDSDMEQWELTMFDEDSPLCWVVGLHLDLGDKHWVWFWHNSTFFRKRRWCESLHKHVLSCSVQPLTKQHLSQEALDQTQRHCDYGCPWHRSCRWARACWGSWSKREQKCHVLMARSRWFSQSPKENANLLSFQQHSLKPVLWQRKAFLPAFEIWNTACCQKVGCRWQDIVIRHKTKRQNTY